MLTVCIRYLANLSTVFTITRVARQTPATGRPWSMIDAFCTRGMASAEINLTRVSSLAPFAVSRKTWFAYTLELARSKMLAHSVAMTTSINRES
jgi:hypothetical protein